MDRNQASSGSKLVGVNKDDWHNVSDAKKRKQIQDRLAQRSRQTALEVRYMMLRKPDILEEIVLIGYNIGKRLRDEKSRSSETSQQSATPADPTLSKSYAASNSNTTGVDIEEDTSFDPVACLDTFCTTMVLDNSNSTNSTGTLDITMNSSTCFGDMMPLFPLETPTTSDHSSCVCCSFRILPNLNHELPYKLTPITALYINGEVLGLSCCTSIPAKSKPAAPHVPLSLRPTPAQLFTFHLSGVDRFPFPKMRDNIISLSGFIDDEELCRDMMLMPTFSFTPGALPWNPKAWKVEKPFADKWGFLFR
ncbi:hypothetical protein HYFRA_00002551 [Hymenoscyphus fraxineus]|uniref:Uncharacterized protein n=1 Tax=Hymenoscyphus fraxineus TaxID=746836 RepID=A0A9N9PV66_9HELO|nr:hypothetical protein HYFRA_00002551 [Hymenoscyphus fraxineus]